MPIIHEDCLVCPPLGHTHIRFIHGIPDAPAVDIYIRDVLVSASVKYGHSNTPSYAAGKVGKIGTGKNTDSYHIPITVKVAGTNDNVFGPYKLYAISGGIYTIVATKSNNNSVSAIVLHDNKGTCCDKLQEHFNPEKYAGVWFQIADIPQYYEQGCQFESAVYTILQDKIKVTNTCYDGAGKIVAVATGAATAINPAQPAALRVSFPDSNRMPNSPGRTSTGSNTPGPNYLVHWTDYQTAMVGSPSRNSIYLLSRSPVVSASKYNKFLKYAAEYGYDVNRIKVNPRAINN
jgi:apolipoprotein D and lipocalin family protein